MVLFHIPYLALDMESEEEEKDKRSPKRRHSAKMCDNTSHQAMMFTSLSEESNMLASNNNKYALNMGQC